MLARLILLMTFTFAPAASAQTPYPWLDGNPPRESLHTRVKAPEGFTRVAVVNGSWAHWLRHLPMAPKGTAVRAYDGRVLERRPLGVIDLDIGDRDLQQCADTIMRLRAEYLRGAGRADEVAFRFVSGDLAKWADYRAGRRPQFKRKRAQPIRWLKQKGARTGDGEAVWRGYLRLVFGYASTLSLEAYNKQPRVKVAGDIRPGDFFVLGGSPGHTVIVLDVATNRYGETRLLIGQGFMPAQSMHLVPAPSGGAWHKLDDKGRLHIDVWPTPFPLKSLRTFSRKER